MNEVVAIQNADWTAEQLKLITNVIAKGATSDELKLFLYRCKNMGLDPLKPGQIYFIKYGTGPGTIVVGIEGFRTKAAKTGKLTGIKRGPLRDDKGNCVGAWAEVYRSDWTHPAREEVPMDEYNTGKGNWQKMPETMIKKVAEAAALRMAFPDELGGVYTSEELEQVGTQRGGIHPGQPEEGDGFEDSSYRIPGGQWKGLKVEEVYTKFGPEKMAGYVKYLEEKFNPLLSWQKEFIEQCEVFLGSKENAAMKEEGEF